MRYRVVLPTGGAISFLDRKNNKKIIINIKCSNFTKMRDWVKDENHKRGKSCNL